MPTFATTTVNITINRDPKTVYKFISNLTNLPKWAKTFCRSIKKSNNTMGECIIETPQGPVEIRIAPKNNFGIVDHYISPAEGKEVLVPLRVVPNGSGTEVIFTVFQQPHMSDESYKKDIELVKQDLKNLKEIMGH